MDIDDTVAEYEADDREYTPAREPTIEEILGFPVTPQSLMGRKNRGHPGGRGKKLTVEGFWALTSTPDPETGCRMWLGGLIHDPKARAQFGRVRWEGRRWAAHRLAWVLTHDEPLLPTIAVVQVCGNSLCCEPSHLAIEPRGGTLRKKSAAKTIFTDEER